MKHLFKVNYLIEKTSPVSNKSEKQIKSINVVDYNAYGENVIQAIKENIEGNGDETFIELESIKYEGQLNFCKVEKNE